MWSNPDLTIEIEKTLFCGVSKRSNTNWFKKVFSLWDLHKRDFLISSSTDICERAQNIHKYRNDNNKATMG